MDNRELLAILDQLERDKGINKNVLIEAVEAAVASAAKKIWTVDSMEEIKVVINRKTGKLTAYAGEHEIRSSEFGRIAAQTAKQVVIQKIREAEKDVVYQEYQNRIGQIISGGVYRFEKGNIIVDLGKSEGYLPKSEISGKEEFKQGDRIRAYVLDVTREAKGPQIILSRANPNFVKRLFELEVPEIYEGIVEIKSISRAVGERTKIAVYSKDDKVDCVGACVGMRGARVKNIVNELQGEKIDIVRYSSDIKEYIQAALSPAEISQIQINAEDKKANLIVAEDQLSLAIGKKGQNVRLASELVGWELNIFTAEQWTNQQDGPSPEEPSAALEEGVLAGEPEQKSQQPGSELAQLKGAGPKVVQALEEAGFLTIESIAAALPDDLTPIKGLGKIKAERLIEEAKSLMGQNK
ncbi:MAG TPA: transcription termination factor NusA [Candidatus Omnitrophota bacterium]|jgi:N utilization substance protein A|nr:transcription termination factor NusA [Candidatus Omnitrophota bacterium]HPN55405.1 transcription termination factor NusA [Candidatus Omnitrophota bacterium]